MTPFTYSEPGRRGIDRAVPRAAGTGLRRVASLDDEVGDDSVEDRVVEEAVAGERDQRCCRVGRELGVEVDRERSAARLEHERVAHACVERLCRRLVALGLAGSGRLDALALIVRGGRLVVPAAPCAEHRESEGDCQERAAHRVRSYPRGRDEMRVGVGRLRADARAPRRGVGGAQPRRPAPLRDAHARRCPGRAVLEHDPEQARGVHAARLPASTRRRSHGSPRRTSSACSRTPASSATG